MANIDLLEFSNLSLLVPVGRLGSSDHPLYHLVLFAIPSRLTRNLPRQGHPC